MASFFNLGRFGRQSDRKNGVRQDSPSRRSNNSSNVSSPLSPSSGATMPPYTIPGSEGQPQTRRAPLYFFREENSNLIVKGNFMTLAAKPEYVDKGEWLAHQVVEQYRLLEGMIKVIQEVDANSNLPPCNPHSCPTMSAAEFTYTWLDNQRNPVRIPATQYINLVQKWILGKINNPEIFPTGEPNYVASSHSNGDKPIPVGPSTLSKDQLSAGSRDWVGKASGFPENFENDIKSLYRQMFRCYAHLYHGHWLEPFYHLGATKELNTCFIHFINVGRLFCLLNEKDLRPMQPLIDIWQSKDLLCAPPAVPQQFAAVAA